MKISLLLIPILLFSYAGFSANKTTAKTDTYPELTTDMRAKMADMHQQMATCLKSEKSFEECRNNIAGNCHEFGQMMPMMGRKNMMHGRQGMMGGYPGMMTGFCGDQWLKDQDTKKEKTKK